MVDFSIFLKLSVDFKVRGHTYKIVENSFRLDARKFFLVMTLWMHGMICLRLLLMQKL